MKELRNINSYQTLIFDCDGVVLNSNHLKTAAFWKTTQHFGESASKAMVDYHKTNGGVSRYIKFRYFLEHIAPIYAPYVKPKSLDDLIADYAKAVKQELLECEMATGLTEMRKQTQEAQWMIVSGGDQVELREVFSARGIADWFDGGLFGSPDAKPEILAREIANGNIQYPAIFIGDSQFDYQCAKASGIDFVFIHGWTEVTDWQRFVADEGIPSFTGVKNLLKF